MTFRFTLLTRWTSVHQKWNYRKCQLHKEYWIVGEYTKRRKNITAKWIRPV